MKKHINKNKIANPVSKGWVESLKILHVIKITIWFLAVSRIIDITALFLYNKFKRN